MKYSPARTVLTVFVASACSWLFLIASVIGLAHIARWVLASVGGA
jgi:hypothetical protein